MLRGSASAKVDEKGRVKVPAHYRQFIETTYGRDLFVTSLDGQFARIYPLPVWLEIEQKLAAQSSFEPVVMRFREAVTYYGAAAAMDRQGRVLVHPLLRERAGIKDEVSILGQLTYLDLWNRKQLDERIKSRAFTDEDLRVLAGKGF